MTDITIFTDGSSTGKVGPGGWGYYMVTPSGASMEQYGGEKGTTNNRMEMMAIIAALRDIMKHQHLLPVTSKFSIWSDSQYCIKGITLWIHKWKKLDFEGIKNQDLWLDFYNLYYESGLNLSIHWIKGHSNHYGNERADQLAKKGKLSVTD